MPATRTTCNGCNRPFPSIIGYRSHLFQTRDPLCVAVRKRLAAANGQQPAHETQNADDSEATYSDTTSTASSTESSDTESQDEEAPAFGGDFFGGPEEYKDDLFGQEEAGRDDGHEGDVDNDEEMGALDEFRGSDIEDELTAELEDDMWDPVRERVPSNVPLNTTNHNQAQPAHVDEDADLEAAVLAEVQARKTADEIVAAAGHGVKPASTIRYSEVHRSSKVARLS